MGHRPFFGLPLKHYDYESIQISACRPYGRPYGVFGGLLRTVAAHNLVVLIFKTDDIIFNQTKFFKFKKHLFADKRVFIRFKADSFLFNKEADFVSHHKSKQFFFLDKKHFLPDAADLTVDSKTSESLIYKADFNFIVFTVKHIAQHRQAG